MGREIIEIKIKQAKIQNEVFLTKNIFDIFIDENQDDPNKLENNKND